MLAESCPKKFLSNPTRLPQRKRTFRCNFENIPVRKGQHSIRVYVYGNPGLAKRCVRRNGMDAANLSYRRHQTSPRRAPCGPFFFLPIPLDSTLTAEQEHLILSNFHITSDFRRKTVPAGWKCAVAGTTHWEWAFAKGPVKWWGTVESFVIKK